MTPRRSRADTVGTEPDYRFTLANERTVLAWLRTSLALLAAGVAVVQLVPDLGVDGARVAIGAAMGLLSIYTVLAALWRWRAVQTAMRLDAPLPPAPAVILLGGGLVLVSVTVTAVMLVGA